MKTVRSEERSTGMGATHYAAVLIDGEFVCVSRLSDVRYKGHDHGWEIYEVAVSDDTITAQFDRSNRGNENVTASNGMSWRSFEAAQRWAAKQS